jgi:serine phosphatase RsbU (regulator of sigma subunit)
MNIFNFLKPDYNRIQYSKEYLEHLNSQGLALQRPLSFVASFAWLVYAFYTDPKLHPEFPELLYFRLALTAAGIIVFAASFVKRLRGRGLGWIYFLGVFLLLSCSFFTGRLANDSAYVAGLQLIIMIAVLVPVPYHVLFIFYSISIALFIASIALYYPGIESFSVRYSLNNLTLAYLMGYLLGFIMDKLRFSMFLNQLHLKISNQALVEAHDALWGEMELAKKIQTVLLPEQPSVKGCEISTYMSPAAEVGGDYYDIINAGDTDWIVVGDVSGHGVSSGLITMMAQASINTLIVHNHDVNPSEILSAVNKTIAKNIKRIDEEKFMTTILLRCREPGTFLFSGILQDIMVYRKSTDSVELVKAEGILLGIMYDIDESTLKNLTLSLEIGDVLLLYTDGVTESWRKGSIPGHRDPRKDMFGIDRLKDIFQSVGNRPTQEIKVTILKELEGYVCTDDVTMVILKRKE